MTWRVSWQDYRGWRERDGREPRPVVLFRDYQSKDDAEREVRLQRLAGMTVCIEERDDMAAPRRTKARPARARQGALL